MSYHWRNSAISKKKSAKFSFAERVEQRLDREEHLSKWLVYLQIALVLVLVVLVIFAIFSARDPNNFPVKRVKIEATFKHVKKQELQKVVAPYVDKAGFFSLHADGLREAVLQIPWVYNVEVKRVWPDKITIKVDEQKPLFIWNKSSLVNVYGGVFTPNANTIPQDLPRLFATSDRAQDMLNNFVELTKLLAPFNWKIVGFSDKDMRGWHLVLNNGMQIFANEANALDSIKDFLQLYKKVQEQNKGRQPEVIDVRYKDGFAVKWTAGEGR